MQTTIIIIRIVQPSHIHVYIMDLFSLELKFSKQYGRHKKNSKIVEISTFFRNQCIKGKLETMKKMSKKPIDPNTSFL